MPWLDTGIESGTPKVDGNRLLIDLFLKRKTLVVCNVMMYEMHDVMMFSGINEIVWYNAYMHVS